MSKRNIRKRGKKRVVLEIVRAINERARERRVHHELYDQCTEALDEIMPDVSFAFGLLGVNDYNSREMYINMILPKYDFSPIRKNWNKKN